MGAEEVRWKVSFNLLVNVFIDSVIVPLSLCARSSPIKSLSLENLTSKCCFNLVCISYTSCAGPEIKASSTYRIRNATWSFFRYRNRQGSLGHWVKAI